MEFKRQDPEALLRLIQEDSEKTKKGHLKLFFGYAAGVGKTYAMLQAAHAMKDQGVDVVIGYIEPHTRPATIALLEGLEQQPMKPLEHHGIQVNEFDLDEALKRHPQLMLVDELAHTNAQGCRHAKRYQDVAELLNAGIDVYSTVNVQHIESLNDLVASVTGVMVKERIPDSVFDEAHQVELVDLEPEELLIRLKEGKIYQEAQVNQAMAHFFTIENLTALREFALRRCADRVSHLVEQARMKTQGEYHTDEHILVCLSSSPSNEKIIRTGARMAAAFKANFTALFVETPSFSQMREEDRNRLRSNIRLAEQLGATIETVYGEDVPYQIGEFARLSGVSKIVLGRSSVQTKRFFGKPAFTEQLVAIAPNLDIYIIPKTSVYQHHNAKSKQASFSLSLLDSAKSILMLLVATLIGFLFSRLGFSEANIITVYILAVLIISIVTQAKIYSLISSIVSVLVFNFFFTVPKFTFMAYEKGYPVTFLIMFLAALLTSSLAVKLKSQVKQSAQSAFRTKVLFDTNQLLQKARSEEEIMSVIAKQLMKLLNRDVVMYPVNDGSLLEPSFFTLSSSQPNDLGNEHERSVAAWVLKNNKHAGASTNTLGASKCLYLSIRLNDAVYGVVGIHIDVIPLDSFEKSVLLSILGECALALENMQNLKEKQQAAILAKNEQLRANLLRAISHDLRTPLTSILGNASNLLSNGTVFDEQTKQQMYTDIYDDTMWLINLVENLLSVTKIEEGSMNLHFSTELIDEVISEALKHIDRRSIEHHITVQRHDELYLAYMDAKLIVQVVINIVDNAIKYTPKGSHIDIGYERINDMIEVRIADDGPGIQEEHQSRVFDMFYSGANTIADSRRSLGLGLSLCKSIILAHGGEIKVENQMPHGTIFTFTLPAKEVNLHEQS